MFALGNIARKIIPLPLYSRLRFLKKRLSEKKALSIWESSDKTKNPPHVIKQRTIIKYKNKFRINILVETGTYLGEMVYAQLDNFSKIISIELDKALYQNAKKLFKSYSHVEILEGDSSEVLSNILPQVKEKSIFWLDGHYSGGITAKGNKECPIYEELNSILNNDFNHIILIDDADSFVGKNDYPTINEIELFIKSKKPNYRLEVQSNIIISYPV